MLIKGFLNKLRCFRILGISPLVRIETIALFRKGSRSKKWRLIAIFDRLEIAYGTISFQACCTLILFYTLA